MHQHHTRTRRTVILVAAALIGLVAATSSTAEGTLERGIAASDVERFDEVFELLQRRAETDDPNALYPVGEIHVCMSP